MSAFFIHHPRETDLALFAGGELGPLARWRIERHIESCKQCEEIAADFFRLPDQISELGELPEVDWNAMAASIEGRMRVEAASASPTRERKIGPAAWQLGAVAACLIAVVAVMRQPPSYESVDTVAVSQAEMKQEAQAQPSLESAALAEEPAAEPPAEVRESVAPARQLAKAKFAVEQEPDRELYRSRGRIATEGGVGFTDRDSPKLDLRYNEAQSKEELASDLAAPPPPASPGERSEPAPVITAQAQKRIAPAASTKPALQEAAAENREAPRQRADVGGIARGAAFAGGRAASVQALMLADEADKLEAALRIQPPAGVQFEAVPGADGKITLRYFDPDTGVLTIVDVDAP